MERTSSNEWARATWAAPAKQQRSRANEREDEANPSLCVAFSCVEHLQGFGNARALDPRSEAKRLVVNLDATREGAAITCPTTMKVGDQRIELASPGDDLVRCHDAQVFAESLLDERAALVSVVLRRTTQVRQQ